MTETVVAKREWLVIQDSRKYGVFAPPEARIASGYLPRDVAETLLGRSRVGTHNAYDVDPYARVGQNEMMDWCSANGVALNPMFDGALIQPELRRLWKRLKKEYPNEGWTHFAASPYISRPA